MGNLPRVLVPPAFWFQPYLDDDDDSQDSSEKDDISHDDSDDEFDLK